MKTGNRQWAIGNRLALALVACVFLPAAAAAQTDSTGRVSVNITAGERPLADVSVASGGVRGLTDAQGHAMLRLRAGQRLIIAARIGYHPDTLNVAVRAGMDTTINVTMMEDVEEVEEITVSATRSTRHLEDEPTRVEILGGLDVAEKTSMRPQDLTNFVSEMSGVRIQQTAPGRGGAAIRIQGLKGQYTQVLSDGLPLAGALPSGLLLLQMPPVDLLQVEVIKGAATALYGPGALGGIMNLVSRRPDNRTEVVASVRDPAGGDAFLWTSRQLGERTGLSLVGDVHAQDGRDRDGDNWMDLNRYRRFGVRPRFYWTGASGATLLATAGGMVEDREGGTIPGTTAPDLQPFDNGVDTRRYDGGLIGSVPLKGSAVVLHFRTSAAYLDQDARYGTVQEHGQTTTLFGEGTLALAHGQWDGLVGVAAQDIRYRNSDVAAQEFDFTTPSLFGQVTWTPAAVFATTLAGRCDQHNRYGRFCSPRLSLLYHLSEHWSARLSAGTGFFAPTPFTEASEPLGLTPIAPLSVAAERGKNASFDLSGAIGKVELTATVFSNELDHAVTLSSVPVAGYPRQFVNAPGAARTSGGEIFAVYEGAPIVITAFYSYLWATEVDPVSGVRHEAPRNPRHNFFVDLAYETRGTWIALEVNWLGKQALDDDPSLAQSPSYANVELLASRTFGAMTFYVNADNLFDVMQTDHAPLLRPTRPAGQSWTVGQWAPVEGRLISLGMRYRF